jgi:hypothetical protein
MESGRMRYEFEKLEASSFVRSVTEEFGREADRRGGRVELSGTLDDTTVLADRRKRTSV